MIIRKLSLAILTIAVIAPVVASASPEDVALNACAKAFASSIAGGSSVPAYKLNYYDQKQASNSVAGFYARNFSFTMQAQDRKTGTALASATCSADTHGEVLSLTPVAAVSKVTFAAR
jgi:hypothetical protein